MRIPEFDDFDTEGLLTASRQRNWLWFGLIVSLTLHIVLCTYFYRTRFQFGRVADADAAHFQSAKCRPLSAVGQEQH
jgi:hypothetical protein